MSDAPSKLTAPRMLKLQAKLNRIFVEKRDAGQSTARIYTQLRMVEHWLGDRGIFWGPCVKRELQERRLPA